MKPTWLVVGMALTLFWWMAASVSPRMGVTADEVVHLTGGYTYWKFNDYRMHPENGTLPMRIAALPWLGMDLAFPSLYSENWRLSQVNLVGDEFFFRLGNPLETMLWRARLMIALIGAFTVWLTWRWAHGLFGRHAGFVALALAVFCPALLAHSGLATSDVTMTACVLSALSLVWLVFHRVTWLRVIGAMVVCGLAFLSKVSGVLIVPLIGGLLALRCLRPVPLVWALGRLRWLRRRGQIALACCGLTMAIAAGSLVVLWAGYGFRFEAFNRAISPADDFFFSWDVVLDKATLPYQDTPLGSLIAERPPMKESTMSYFVAWLRDRRLLPEAYLWGFAHTYKFSRYRPAYFRGEYRATGWRTFFPTAFLMKTPLPAVLLIGAGVAALVARSRRRGNVMSGTRFKPWAYRAAPLLLFFAVYWVMAIRMSLNIGHRHILPTYPVFYVLASASVIWLAGKTSRVLTAGLVALLVLHAGESLLARPFYLSYFQPLFGGPKHGHRHLVDSSFDWGQGLPDLARWLDEKKARRDPSPVFLTYFGADSPRARQLEVVRFADDVTDIGPRTYPAQIRGGWFVISATHFRRVYMPIRRPWGEKHEQLYRTTHANLVALQSSSGSNTPEAQSSLHQYARNYEILQFGRLCHYLGERDPDAVIGGSLLAYRLTDAEVAFALYAPLAEIEQRRGLPFEPMPPR